MRFDQGNFRRLDSRVSDKRVDALSARRSCEALLHARMSFRSHLWTVRGSAIRIFGAPALDDLERADVCSPTTQERSVEEGKKKALARAGGEGYANTQVGRDSSRQTERI